MASNINVEHDPHIGTVPVATDEINGVHYPVYKQSYGIDGEQTPVSLSSPLPTRMGTGDLTVDAWGLPKFSLPVSVFHGMWTFDIPQSMWFMYEDGTQVYTSTDITSTDGAAKLLTTVTNTELILESRECPRYQPNRGHLFSTALWCPNATADGIRNWGLSTDENGVSFRLKADGKLYAVINSDGVEIHEEEIDTSGVTSFDVTKGNVYDIQYQWRGVGNYKFFINLTLVHTINYLGTLAILSIQNPALPIHFHAERTTEDVAMHVGCADITSEGGIVHNQEQYCSAYAETVTVNGADAPVIAIKVPLQINSLTNTRTDTLARITVVCTKKATFKVWMTRDATALTGATFKKVTGGTFVETDSIDNDGTAVRAAAVTVSKLNFVRAIHVEPAIPAPVDNPFRGRIEFPMVRGDYLVVTCTASNAAADCDIEWGEQI